ncbi:hypothetical protein [Pedobacter punctiformis]|uniref:Lipoprotein n=1 Tax=Pedobacter punctiformis TaxID=3004097 RepID=A0ABT4LD06_9SPHI|nr:hypothetical protein [Pedobacter sp. HCMS5-2]MCZ4245043.1 hypothetical protein [Pedobacter sp. HCMS5-2]
MKKFNRNFRKGMLSSLGLLLLLINACKKNEAPLTPSDTPEFGYTLPQGNHDYDQRILGYYNRWGTYVLYKFTQQDITFQLNDYDKNYKTVPADGAYINPQLDLLESTFFKYYSDSTLRKYLPTKFFLCSSLLSGTTSVNAYLTNLANTYQGGFQSFAANGGSSTVSTINKTIYRSDLNFSFLRKMDMDFKIPESPLFLSLSDYTSNVLAPTLTQPITSPTLADWYKRGFLGGPLYTKPISPDFILKVPLASSDWQSYIQAIVSNPYSYLTDPTTTATDATAKGILSPIKDTNGLIKRKYDAIVAHYKMLYNIDLQAIGNGQ